MNNKQRLAVLIGLLISVVFLWFAFRDLKPQAVLQNLRALNTFSAWLFISAGVALFFLSTWVITLRWQFLLRAIRLISLRRLFALVCIGYMGNNVYPFRTGEALRIFLLQRNDGVPFVRSTMTVLVERVFDGVVMLSFILLPLLFIEVASDELRQVAGVATPIFILAVGVFFVLAARPDLLRRLVIGISRLFPQRLQAIITGLTEDIIGGLQGLRSPVDLAGAVIASYGTWLIQVWVYWVVSFAFEFSVSFWVMMMVVGAVNLAGLIPTSPGQIGVFEFFASAVLVGVGVAEADALTYAIVVHLVIWLPVTVLGFVLFARQGLGWKAITRAREIDTGADKVGLSG